MRVFIKLRLKWAFLLLAIPFAVKAANLDCNDFVSKFGTLDLGQNGRVESQNCVFSSGTIVDMDGVALKCTNCTFFDSSFDRRFNNQYVNISRSEFNETAIDSFSLSNTVLEYVKFINSKSFLKFNLYNVFANNLVFDNSNKSRAEILYSIWYRLWGRGISVVNMALDKNEIYSSELPDIVFKDSRLTNTRFYNTKLDGAKFNSTDIDNTVFGNIIINNAVFAGSTKGNQNVISNTTFKNFYGDTVSFSDLKLTDVNFINSELPNADISGVHFLKFKFDGFKTLKGARFVSSDFNKGWFINIGTADGARFIGDVFSDVLFSRFYGRHISFKDVTFHANIQGGSLIIDSELPEAQFVNFVFDRNTNIKNTKLSKSSFVNSSFIGGDLLQVDLSGSGYENFEMNEMNITDSNLSASQDSKFIGGTIAKSRFLSSRLVNMNFINSQIKNTEFISSDLSGVKFAAKTVLSNVEFKNVSLRSADFKDAIMTNVRFEGSTDLSGATWVNGQVCLPGSIDRCLLPSKAMVKPFAKK